MFRIRDGGGSCLREKLIILSILRLCYAGSLKQNMADKWSWKESKDGIYNT